MKLKIIYTALAACVSLSSFADVNTTSPRTEGGAEGTFTLEQCLDSALVNNRKLKNASLEIERSSELKSAVYTKYFPQISANVLAFHAFDKLIKNEGNYPAELAAFESLMPGISQLAGQKFEVEELNRGYNVSLSVMQPVYAGGQIHTQHQLAELGQDVTKLQLEMKEKEIVEAVSENYWQIAQLYYNLQTLDAADKQLAALYDQVEQYVKAGVTTNNDLLRVQLHQQDLKSMRLKAENGIRVLKLLLAQQCGLTGRLGDLSPGRLGGFDIALPSNTSIAEAPVYVEARVGALQRQEYQLAEKGVEAERLQVKLERGKCLPTVAVGVMGFHMGMGGLSKSVRDYLDTSITNGVVMGTVSVPISDWWSGKHTIRRQKLKLQEAQHDRDEALEMLAIDIEAAWNNLLDAQQQVEVARTAVAQADENLRQSTAKYKVGTESLSDLLDAETLNRQSQNQLSSAFASYHLALTKYELKTKSALSSTH